MSKKTGRSDAINTAKGLVLLCHRSFQSFRSVSQCLLFQNGTASAHVEIHEGMARYPGISILVVNEFLLLLLETPSRHLRTSGVVATTSVSVVSY